MQFSAMLRERLKQSGLSQSELARRLGLKPQAVNQWLHEKSVPSAGRISDIAAALGCRVADLVADGVSLQNGNATGSANVAEPDVDPGYPMIVGFGRRLREAREAIGRDDVDRFAREIGVAASTYTAWEDERRTPSAPALGALSRNCGISVDWVLTGRVLHGRYPERGAVVPQQDLPGEFIQDSDKLALLRLWDALDHAERHRLMIRLREEFGGEAERRQ